MRRNYNKREINSKMKKKIIIFKEFMFMKVMIISTQIKFYKNF